MVEWITVFPFSALTILSSLNSRNSSEELAASVELAAAAASARLLQTVATLPRTDLGCHVHASQRDNIVAAALVVHVWFVHLHRGHNAGEEGGLARRGETGLFDNSLFLGVVGEIAVGVAIRRQPTRNRQAGLLQLEEVFLNSTLYLCVASFYGGLNFFYYYFLPGQYSILEVRHWNSDNTSGKFDQT